MRIKMTLTRLLTVLGGAAWLMFISGPVGCTNALISRAPPHVADDSAGAAGADLGGHPTGIAAAIDVDLRAGSGYLIGAAPDKIEQKRRAEARAAAERSRITPATVEDARQSDTADLNNDGFVTVDEVLAMQKASFSDGQMIDRLQRTRQIFILTEQQKDYLRDRGVSQRVIDAMISMDGGYARLANSTTTPANAQGR